MTIHGIDIRRERIEAFCRVHRIHRPSLFGSILRDDFGPKSDVVVLLEFEPGARVGLMRLVGTELELGELLGRKVDLNTPDCLSRYFRDAVLAEAETLYVAEGREGVASRRAMHAFAVRCRIR